MNGITKKEELQRLALEQIDLTREVSDEELLQLLDRILLDYGRTQYISVKEKLSLRRDIFNSLRKLDILQTLLEDSEITEIMVNGVNHVFIERSGHLSRFPGGFDSVKKLNDVIQQIVSGANRLINESSPIVDARLPCGSRVNVVLPPVALDGPIITIRKFPQETMTMERLISLGSLTKDAADFLRALVEAGYNIFVSGGTGSGKTTFLNALSNYIPSEERVVTIEDSAELQLRNIENLVRLEVRNANVEGSNAVTIRDLIKSSLRMRPDRIIVGEVRDAASIDMLQALNTGHCGMSTGHANSAKDMLSRLETMVLLGADIPLQAVRKQIASALDIICHLGRLRDKSRRVLSIYEVLDCVNGEIALSPLFLFRETDSDSQAEVHGVLIRTDTPLSFTQKLIAAGNVDFLRKEQEIEPKDSTTTDYELS